ncbi:hypothetical protein CHGG_07214 [Chaetomium globosum CBS 148.51]|uniref:Eisosome protein 1 n=1 Tax=Chaetomium globosum (strain ATCC 6205 / CBS 148.51 / DSM 1962 / NBRC 6347 / NRRL 1970) TaxID=306901 RepID=Q2GXU0_CHAGB|nr:uncharacterized protein CHGG_07214 [Chaetomium globosum CBS 148.51]EAQ85961.1 hypothetical protein CHGG_07214 [Chaetomium globosum CBS 148.51]
MASATVTSPAGGASRPMVLPGHSGPLKYANAQDLPSYPSPGLKPGDAAASAAATLGWANTVSPPASPRGHQSETPRSSDALLAAGWAQRQQKPPASPPSLWVSTAANLAFNATKTPALAAERPELSRQNSMRAAKGAMAGVRPRARSSPQTASEKAPNPPSSEGYALSAATIAHRPSPRANAMSISETGAVPYTNMDRQMFTSNPPVKPETDEKNRADVLHASALAMAKRMYGQQQKIIDNSARAHARSASFPGGDASSLASSQDEEQPPLVYHNLQEAAYRLAQERLAKLQEEHDKQRSFQEYYGSGTPQRTKFGTIKGKLTRRRSSSDGDLLEDRRRSEQIRKQMSLLNNKLSVVDEGKRKRDQEALLAAAQRNVRAQLQQMDKKVQSDTGRVPQVTMDDWGRKALVAAQSRSASTAHENAGKVDIGGGKFVDRAEVEKVAAKNVQPLLDEINELAEEEKARLEEERLDEERRKEKAERERMREREIQDIHKKLKGKSWKPWVLKPSADHSADQQKDVERARKAEIKQEEKTRKDEANAAKAGQKHAAEGKKGVLTSKFKTDSQGQAPNIENKRTSAVNRVRTLSINFGKRHPRRKESTSEPISPDSHSTSPTRKVRDWLFSRFPRPRAKTASTTVTDDQDAPDAKKKGFIGGVALARLQGNNTSTPSITDDVKGKGKETATEDRPDTSMREVAMAGRAPTTDENTTSTTTTTATAGPSAILPCATPQI